MTDLEKTILRSRETLLPVVVALDVLLHHSLPADSDDHVVCAVGLVIRLLGNASNEELAATTVGLRAALSQLWHERGENIDAIG